MQMTLTMNIGSFTVSTHVSRTHIVYYADKPEDSELFFHANTDDISETTWTQSIFETNNTLQPIEIDYGQFAKIGAYLRSNAKDLP